MSAAVATSTPTALTITISKPTPWRTALARRVPRLLSRPLCRRSPSEALSPKSHSRSDLRCVRDCASAIRAPDRGLQARALPPSRVAYPHTFACRGPPKDRTIV